MRSALGTVQFHDALEMSVKRAFLKCIRVSEWPCKAAAAQVLAGVYLSTSTPFLKLCRGAEGGGLLSVLRLEI